MALYESKVQLLLKFCEFDTLLSSWKRKEGIAV